MAPELVEEDQLHRLGLRRVEREVGAVLAHRGAQRVRAARPRGDVPHRHPALSSRATGKSASRSRDRGPARGHGGAVAEVAPVTVGQRDHGVSPLPPSREGAALCDRDHRCGDTPDEGDDIIGKVALGAHRRVDAPPRRTASGRRARSARASRMSSSLGAPLSRSPAQASAGGLTRAAVEQRAAQLVVDRAAVVGVDEAEVPQLGALVDVGHAGGGQLEQGGAERVDPAPVDQGAHEALEVGDEARVGEHGGDEGRQRRVVRLVRLQPAGLPLGLVGRLLHVRRGALGGRAARRRRASGRGGTPSSRPGSRRGGARRSSRASDAPPRSTPRAPR